ncbi:MAG: hypothetical protein QM621_02235 [Aeromicrobium sp.]|uniref:hypothetical protein n=1 Tax=Aeromicrobium sp. TaxID=1871063 RepID=UPI0039E52C69
MSRWLCCLPLLVGGLVYALVGHPTLPIVAFELAGDAATAAEVVGERTGDFRAALWSDWLAFIPGYLVTLCLLATRLPRRWAAALLVVLAVAAAGCDAMENRHLLTGLDDGADASFAAGRAWALAKFALLAPALALGLWGLFRRTERDPSTS